MSGGKIKTVSWQVIRQVTEKQREIDNEMRRMEEAFKEKWNQWGIKRAIQKKTNNRLPLPGFL
ncbi:MAG: hypothetical protein HPY89_10960 [Pelotomaculum sp.]|nr:hypothetical protein [Pelotomaculum sp.]